MAPYVSLVLPAFNEAQRLPGTLAQLTSFAETVPWDLEILVVVEQSADGTLEIAREHATQQAETRRHIRVIDSGPQRGKGHAVRSGVLEAQGEFVFYMDVDLSVPLASVGDFVRRFAAEPQVDVLLGNRQHPESRISLAQGWIRRSMGQTFNRILRVLAVAPFPDTQCGFKAFRREPGHAIFSRQRIDGFAFDVEVLLLAQRLGYNISDMPVEWRNSPDSKVRIVRDSVRMLRDAMRVRRLIREGNLPGNER
jgi:dolichyl-phosphate beta-glucosyltransferase